MAACELAHACFAALTLKRLEIAHEIAHEIAMAAAKKSRLRKTK
jgi:hypothetical protein